MELVNNQYYFSAIHQIILTGHWITDHISQELKEYDISEPQYNVLRILSDRKGRPVTVCEISENMVQRSSNITRIVDKLLLKKLVIRKECESNRRKVDIMLTKEGDKYLRKLDKKVYAFHRPMMKNLTIPEAKTLTELIEKLKG